MGTQKPNQLNGIINCIICTCLSPTVSCQSVFYVNLQRNYFHKYKHMPVSSVPWTLVYNHMIPEKKS